MEDKLILGGVEFKSRLLTGTGKFASKSLIPGMIEASECEIITMALRRVDKDSKDENVLSYIPKNITLLPNTSGARTAEEAIKIARIARAAGCGDFIKIEVITDMKYLMPDNEETLKATKVLAAEGFKVLPYMTADLISAKKMEVAGAAAVMPLGSPIGSNKGIQTRDMIKLIIENSNIPVIVDAGIGRPSHAAEAMEMGADAVLVNSAIACSPDPIKMAAAFRKAVEAGREAYLAELAEEQETAYASSPFTAFLEA